MLDSLLDLGRLMRQRFAGDGIDPGTYWLLKAIHCHGAMRVTDLAILAGLDTSTVSRHVQHLHRSGLLERTAHPDDGRAQQVGMTPRGSDLVKQGLAGRRALLSRALTAWDPADIEALDRLLARFVADIAHANQEAVSA